jgi:hypothetical protein
MTLFQGLRRSSLARKRREVEAQFGALEVGEGDNMPAQTADAAEASEPGESTTADESTEASREEV